MILLAFIGMSLAWSFSWFFGKIQTLSILPIELSLFYRMFCGGLLMLLICFATKTRFIAKKQEIKYFLIIAVCNFSINFLLVYLAVSYIASGVAAVIFSLSIIVSEIISAIVEKRTISKKLIISGSIGFIGLVLFINQPIVDIFKHRNGNGALIGVALSILAMTIYSAGNVMVAVNRKRNQTPLYCLIANAMLIGSLVAFVINIYFGNFILANYPVKPSLLFGILPMDLSNSYIYASIYMVIIATVFAFICLFYLVQRVGSTKANYTALVYPVVALITSYFYENFTFNMLTLCGFWFIILAIACEFFFFNKNKALNIT